MKYLISFVIFVVMGCVIGGYAFFLVWVLEQTGVSRLIIFFVSFIFAVVLIALVVAFLTRMREIGKEDKNDYRNY
ncbi:MAG: hypothetical protein ACK4HQ_08480 [Brevinematales bacterium]